MQIEINKGEHSIFVFKLNVTAFNDDTYLLILRAEIKVVDSILLMK